MSKVGSMELKIDDGGEGTLIFVSGQINQDSNFAPIVNKIARGGPITIDLSRVTRISSTGVREWMHVVKAVGPKDTVELVGCTVQFIEQTNMLANFVGFMKIKSLFLPFFCPKCDTVLDEIYEVAALGPKFSAPKCASCAVSMEPDYAENYLAFMER